ncbi:unnamed protein product [Brassica oleracea]
MATSQLHFSELKTGRCKDIVAGVGMLFRRDSPFWESGNVKKVGQEMGVDMLLLDAKKQPKRLCGVSETFQPISMDHFRFLNYNQLMVLANTNADLPG